MKHSECELTTAFINKGLEVVGWWFDDHVTTFDLVVGFYLTCNVWMNGRSQLLTAWDDSFKKDFLVWFQLLLLMHIR